MWLEVVSIKTLCRNRCSPCVLHSSYFGVSIVLALGSPGPSGSPLWRGPQAPEPLPDLSFNVTNALLYILFPRSLGRK